METLKTLHYIFVSKQGEIKGGKRKGTVEHLCNWFKSSLKRHKVQLLSSCSETKRVPAENDLFWILTFLFFLLCFGDFRSPLFPPLEKLCRLRPLFLEEDPLRICCLLKKVRGFLYAPLFFQKCILILKGAFTFIRALLIEWEDTGKVPKLLLFLIDIRSLCHTMSDAGSLYNWGIFYSKKKDCAQIIRWCHY